MLGLGELEKLEKPGPRRSSSEWVESDHGEARILRAGLSKRTIGTVVGTVSK